jgi:hypothetical protein
LTGRRWRLSIGGWSATRMAAMNNFDHILNWKLKLGSHAFPGRDGGTCICEAAIVAAGFPYRPVRSARDMPGCFSPPICVLAMYLNDIADDEERQLLLPFVTRLACADTPEMEGAREVHIAWHLRYGSPFREQLEVLESALAIGRQAGEPAPEAVRTRLEAVRQRAQTPTSVADDPAFTETGAWLAPLL